MLLVSGRVSVPKPLSQIQRSTRWLLQGLSPRTSFGGFGLNDYDRRAYVLRIEVHPAGAGVNTWVSGSISAAYTKDAGSNTYTSALPDHSSLGHGQMAWVEGRNPPGDRYVLLQVTNAGNNHDRYRVSISKPDFAFVGRQVDPMPVTGSTSGTIGSTVTIRNSSVDASLDEFDPRMGRIDCIEVHCSSSAGAPYRSYSFELLRQGRANLLDTKSEQSLDLGTLCEGWILNAAQPARPPVPATPADQIISVTVRLFVDNMLRHEISTTPASGDWPFNVVDTMWHRQSDMMGGLQLLISGWCTSSFGVELKPSSAATILHHGSSNDVQAMSTTGHCHTMGFQWQQGARTAAGPDFEPIDMTLVEPLTTTCKYMRDTGVDMAGNRVRVENVEANCHRGDQTYSQAPVTLSFLNNAIFKPHTQSPNSVPGIIEPRIEYFAADNTGPSGGTIRFEVIAARPPRSGETVHKVGRTTGWTSGNVENLPRIRRSDMPRKSYENSHTTADGYHLECLIDAGCRSRGGDSGSPIFVMMDDPMTDNIEVILVGVHYGGYESSATGVFVPIDRIYCRIASQRVRLEYGHAGRQAGTSTGQRH